MRWKFGMFLVVVLANLSTCGLSFAHHGTAAYNEASMVTLKGTVTKFLWANPHAKIFLDVKDDTGNITHWTTETFSPAKLIHIGWTKDSIKPGDQVIITVYPAKNGLPVGYFLKLVLPDGREIGTLRQR